MLVEIAIICLSLAVGGVLKGAVGAGAPVLAIPVLAAVFDVPFAVAILLMPNLISNGWQIWQYRAHRPGNWFLWSFVVGGMVGVGFGTWVLASLSPDALLAILGVTVLGYIGLRIARPDFRISTRVADAAALPAGLGGGVLQGAVGISAPISMTFLNAIRFQRETFVFTISTYFCLFLIVQLPALALVGVLTAERLGLSVLASIPMLLAMPLGGYLGRRMPAVVFDRIILILLGLLAVKMLFDAFT